MTRSRTLIPYDIYCVCFFVQNPGTNLKFGVFLSKPKVAVIHLNLEQ